MKIAGAPGGPRVPQSVRERIRLAAAAVFAAGQDGTTVAKQLRVSVRSVQRWRGAWRNGGQGGLRSKGPACHPKLRERLFAVLEEE